MARIAMTWLLAAASLASAANVALATEGGVGRPMTGLQVTPFAGVVPPGPQIVFSVTPIVYVGNASAEVEFPVAGQVALGIDVAVSYSLVTVVGVWRSRTPRWSFASGASAPIAHTNASATLSAAGQSVRSEEAVTSLHDVLLVPITAGYHVSDTTHLSFGLTAFAPTGSYQVGRLANNGMNVWTFVPTMSGTKLLPGRNIELTATTALEFYTRNDATDYDSGVLYRLDVLAMKRLANGLGIGAAFGWIQQISDDEGSVAARLNGFRGRSFGVGPNLTYTRKLSSSSSLDLGLRWVPEFAVSNRPEGNGFMVSATLTF